MLLGIWLTQVDRSRGLIVGQTVLLSARAPGAPDEEGRRQDRLPHQVRHQGNVPESGRYPASSIPMAVSLSHPKLWLTFWGSHSPSSTGMPSSGLWA
jgi:hypothetical protein